MIKIVALLLIAACGAVPSGASDLRALTPNIVNGTKVLSASTYPWMASLYNRQSGRYGCGGKSNCAYCGAESTEARVC